MDAGHRWFGPNNAADVWSVKKVSPQKMGQLTEKPVELAVRAIQYSSRQGENVLDLFGGVGRWGQFTGQRAERAPARREATYAETREAVRRCSRP